MKSSIYISKTIMLSMMLISGGILFSCSHSGNEKETAVNKVDDIEKSDSVPTSVKRFVRAVADRDSVSFASMVSYPLSRPYPLRDIADSTQMVHYYNTIVDDSLYNVVTGSGPEAWENYGWRGWTVDRGEYIWIDENLYDISYLSYKEKTMLDSLVTEEMESLPTQMRDGWSPVICLQAVDGGSVYRVDSHAGPGDENIYRLSIYATDSINGVAPALILTGHREVEGSASTTSYHFSDETGDNAIYEADVTDTDNPRLIFSDKGKRTVVNVRKAYWRELNSRGK